MVLLKTQPVSVPWKVERTWWICGWDEYGWVFQRL